MTTTLTMEEGLGSYQGQPVHLALYPILFHLLKDSSYLRSWNYSSFSCTISFSLSPSPLPLAYKHVIVFVILQKRNKSSWPLYGSKHFLTLFFLFKEKLLKRVIFNHYLCSLPPTLHYSFKTTHSNLGWPYSISTMAIILKNSAVASLSSCFIFQQHLT